MPYMSQAMSALASPPLFWTSSLLYPGLFSFPCSMPYSACRSGRGQAGRAELGGFKAVEGFCSLSGQKPDQLFHSCSVPTSKPGTAR